MPPRFDKLTFFADLGYTPHAGQLLVHESRAPRRVLACGSRWGKSMACSFEAVAALMQPAENSIGWVVCPSLDLTDRIFVRALDALKSRIPHRLVEADPRERKIVVRNLAGGLSEMRGKSAEHSVSLLGEGLDWLIADECARMKRTIWETHLAQRLVDKQGWGLFASTPRGANNWLYAMFRRGQNGRDPQYESWQSPSSANPYLDAATIEAERKRLPPDAFAQEFEAKFIGQELEPCDRCGGPSDFAAGVIVLRDDQEPLRCPECDGYVHADGRTAMTRGGARIVKIRRMEGDPPALPGEEPKPAEPLSLAGQGGIAPAGSVPRNGSAAES